MTEFIGETVDEEKLVELWPKYPWFYVRLNEFINNIYTQKSLSIPCLRPLFDRNIKVYQFLVYRGALEPPKGAVMYSYGTCMKCMTVVMSYEIYHHRW